MHATIDFLLIYKRCSALHDHIGLIWALLMAARVFLYENARLEVLPLMGLTAYAMASVMTTGMVLMRDNCLTELLPGGQQNPFATVVRTLLEHIVWYAMFPAMAEHAWMFERITLVTTPVMKYSQYRAHQADPEHWGLLAIFVTSSLRCLASIAARHCLAKPNFCAFLKTI